MEEKRVCKKCGNDVSNGKYGYYGNNNDELCYDCLKYEELMEIESAAIGEKHLFYYIERHGKNDDGSIKKSFQTFVSNWPGTIEYPCITDLRNSRNNWGYPVINIWFRDHLKRVWYGRIVNPDTHQDFYAKRLKRDYI